MADRQVSMTDIEIGSGLGVFRDEIRPQLDALESGLKALQEGSLDAHGLADLWRLACTIKDKALARGIHDICAAAQLMEEAMHMVSHDRSRQTPEMVGFLQELKNNIAERVEQHDADLPLDSLRQSYHALVEGEAGGGSSPSDIDAIKQSFYAEVKQQLALAHRCLVAMEKGDVEDDGLEALHRLAGNIRISATMMGIGDVADAAHFLEDASEYLIRYPEHRGRDVGRRLLDMHDQLYARLDEHAQPMPLEEIRHSFIKAVMERKRAIWAAGRPALAESPQASEAEPEAPSALQNEAFEPAGEAVSDAGSPSETDRGEAETPDSSQLDWDLATGDVSEAAALLQQDGGDAAVEDRPEVAPGFDLQSLDIESLQLNMPESTGTDEGPGQGMDDWSERTVELEFNAAMLPAEEIPVEEADASDQADKNEAAMDLPLAGWDEAELESPDDASDMSEGEQESPDENNESEPFMDEDEASNASITDWTEASFELPDDGLVSSEEEHEQGGETGIEEQAEEESIFADAAEDDENVQAADLSHDDSVASMEDMDEPVEAGPPVQIGGEDEPVQPDAGERAEEEVALAREAEADESTDAAGGQDERAIYDYRPDVPELAPEDGLGQTESLVRVEAERLVALAARVHEFSLDKSTADAIAVAIRSTLSEMQDMQDMWPSIRRGPSDASIGEYKADLQSMDTFLYKQPQVIRQIIKALRRESDRQAMLVDDLRAQLKGLVKGSMGSLFSRLPAHVHHLAGRYNRQLRLCVDGTSVELLCSMMEAVEEMLLVLLNHAIAHGIEPVEERRRRGKPEVGQVTIAARQQVGGVLLEVINDGCGIDPDTVRQAALDWGVYDHEKIDAMDDDTVLNLIFEPGMPAGGPDEEQRDGGMSTMQNLIRSLGGRVKVLSELDRGTCISLALPLGVPLRSVVVLRVRGHRVGILSESVLQMIALGEQEIVNTDGAMAITYVGETVPLVDLRGEEGHGKEGQQPMVVVARHADGLVGMVVDGFEENREVELFEPDAYIERCCPGVYEGVTILDDGSILLLLNPAGVADMRMKTPAGIEPLPEEAGLQSGVARGSILLMDGAISDSHLPEDMLHARGYHVDVAADDEAIIERLDKQLYDLVIVDLDAPNSDGLNLVRRVRNHERLEYIPIMAISMSDRPKDRLRGLEAGADAYIEKQNMDLDNCLNTVDALIHIYKAQIPDHAATLHERRSSHDAGPES